MTAERRIDKKIFSYWNELSSDNKVPCESDINPEKLSDIWDDCFLVTVDPEGNYKYSYLGQNILDAARNDNESIQEIASFLTSPDEGDIFPAFKKAVIKKEIVTDEMSFTNKEGLNVSFRRSLFPLKNKQGEIKYLFGGIRWTTK